MRRIEITGSTMAQANPSALTEGRSYYYQGDPTRTPDSRHFRGWDPEPAAKTRPPQKSSEARMARYKQFCKLRAQGKSVQEAAGDPRVNVQPKTAARYERDRKAAPEATP